jgi:transcriptional regulator with XRE-family HTH domain
MITKYEKNIKKPNIEILITITGIIKVSIDELLTKTSLDIWRHHYEFKLK